jgi:hypothetical protein
MMMYLREFRRNHNYMPTIADMARDCGMHRTSIVWHLTISLRVVK